MRFIIISESEVFFMQLKLMRIKRFLFLNTVLCGIAAFAVSALICTLLAVPISACGHIIFTIVAYAMVFVGFFGGIIWAMVKM